VRVRDVLGCQHAFLLRDALCAVIDLDASATTSSNRLEDPEGARITLTLSIEGLVLLMDEVADRCDYEVFGELGAHAAHVTPEQIFSAKLRGAREVVRLLILIEVLNVFRANVACPLQIEQVTVVGLEQVEACSLARVNHCIVDARRVRDAKRHEEVLYLFASIHSNAISDAFDPDVARVLEEGDRWSALKDRLEEGDLTCVRLKHAIRQATFIFL